MAVLLMSGIAWVGSGVSAQADQNESAVRRIAASSVAVGGSHTCVMFPGGGVRCWGLNNYGQLGYGNTTDVGDGSGPSVKEVGNVRLGSKAVAISAGGGHTCGLLTTGAIRCWGLNNYGQLGYGNTTDVGDGSGPSIKAAGDVPLGGKAVAITAGGGHTCALLTTGAVRCWGDNRFGQLGYGNTTDVGDGSGPSIKAAGDVPLGGKAVAITAGPYHTCALLTTGALRCWGEGLYGRLGYDSTDNVGDGVGPSIEAVGDVPLGGSAVAASAGQLHTCALLTSGAVRCWGYAYYGQLGYGNTSRVGDGAGPSIEAAGDVPLGGSAIAITAGSEQTCAVLTTRAARCWGRNNYGQLGYGNTSDVGDGSGPSIEAAGDVPLGGDEPFAISSRANHTCVVLGTGAVRCWGLDSYGQLGYGNTQNVGNGSGPSIVAAGDVPIGVAARLKADPYLTERFRPTRDRSSPYVFRIHGALTPSLTSPFQPDPAVCAGTVKLRVKAGSKKLLAKSVAVSDTCTYRTRVKILFRQLPWKMRQRIKNTSKPGFLDAQVTFAGTRNLNSARAIRRLEVG